MTCIDCGKEDHQYNYLCQDCYLKTNQVIESRPRIKIKICKQCSAAFVRTEWRPSPEAGLEEKSFEEAIADSIMYNYKIKPLKEFELHIEFDETYSSYTEASFPIVKGIFALSGKPDAFLPLIQITEPFSVYIKYRRCHSCANLETAGTAALKVQIRGAERQLNEISEVTNQHFREHKVSPSADVTLKDGWDLSFHNTAARAGSSLTDLLKDEYGAILIKTQETIGYDRIKSRSKVRSVISVRLPSFLTGDIIAKEDKPFQLLSIRGKSIKVYNFLEMVKQIWDKEVIWDSRTKMLLPREELVTFQLFTIDNRTHSLQFMNLSSYEIYEVLQKQYTGKLEEGTEVKGYIWNDQLYLSQV